MIKQSSVLAQPVYLGFFQSYGRFFDLAGKSSKERVLYLIFSKDLFGSPFTTLDYMNPMSITQWDHINSQLGCQVNWIITPAPVERVANHIMLENQ